MANRYPSLKFTKAESVILLTTFLVSGDEVRIEFLSQIKYLKSRNLIR